MKGYSRFEKARVIGARALQISMGAPVLVEVPENTINAIDIAVLEYESGVLPLITRPPEDDD